MALDLKGTKTAHFGKKSKQIDLGKEKNYLNLPKRSSQNEML
jgi:hypothetical protein